MLFFNPRQSMTHVVYLCQNINKRREGEDSGMELSDLTLSVGTTHLEHFLMNAPGPRKGVSDMRELGKSNSSAIVWGSITLKQRRGHPEPRYFYEGNFALNSIGLENIGWRRCIKHLEELQGYGKPLWLSLAAFSMTEFFEFFESIHEARFKGVVELNLTCPNMEGKRIIAYDTSLVAAIVKRARDVLGESVTLGVKLNYHPDTQYTHLIAEILSLLNVDFVVLGNTVPDALAFSAETLQPHIKPNDGLAGLSGPYIKPLHLGLVRRFRAHFDELGNTRIKIVGLGGIETGQDVLEYLVAGADICQVGTLYGEKGPRVFDRILGEFFERAQAHGFSSIEDIRRQRNKIWD